MAWLGPFILVGLQILAHFLVLTVLDNNVTSSPAELAQNATYNEEAEEEYYATKTGKSTQDSKEDDPYEKQGHGLQVLQMDWPSIRCLRYQITRLLSSQQLIAKILQSIW